MRAEIFEDVNEKVLKVVANRSNIRFVMPDDEVPSRTETFESAERNLIVLKNTLKQRLTAFGKI